MTRKHRALAAAAAVTAALGLAAALPAHATPVTIFNGFAPSPTSSSANFVLTGGCPGGKIVAGGYSSSAITFGIPTDAKGGTWAADGGNNSASTQRQTIWRRTGGADLAAGDVVTLNYTGTSNPGLWVGCVADSGATLNTTGGTNHNTGSGTGSTLATSGTSAVLAPSPEPAYQIGVVGLGTHLDTAVLSGSATGGWIALGTVNNGTNTGMAIYYRTANAGDSSNNTFAVSMTNSLWMVNWTDVGFTAGGAGPSFPNGACELLHVC